MNRLSLSCLVLSGSLVGRRAGHLLRLRAALVAGALLPACSVLPQPSPVDVYRLPAPAFAAASAAPAARALPWSLRVARPASGTPLEGQRIVVMPEGDRVSVYKGASWSEPAPLLLRDRLLDAFRADGRVASLSHDERALQADFELDSDLRAFHSEYRDGVVEVVIRLDARLLRPSLRRIVASRSFELREPVSGTAVPEVVQAFGKASDRLAEQVVAWTVERAAAAE